ncbi:M56 family metallopeptidase [Desulfotomaculum sp. 1211_IL3151]|uniref:M56 family metallopeptidase n=1 Tax=Desulfotomaculum sp. 1211_IL3151 TaxID=3084055 RepID=UPI002FDA4AAB
MDFLPALFSSVLNMSITTSYVILFVMLTRLFLKKMPKIFSYALWAVVLFRFLCPFSFSSAFSFLKAITPGSGKMDYIPSDIGMRVQPQLETGIGTVNSISSGSLAAAMPYASANSMEFITFVMAGIWALGVLVLIIYSVASYFLLKRKVSTAMLLQDNVFACENIATPFVLGIINPKIYLPIGLSETEKRFIVKHEQTHIRRFDYIIKPVAFLVLCIHWFNPLAWISFVLMSRDMEMSCDEQVINELGPEIKKEYSASLLSLAMNGKMISGSPLSFGETGVKGRIKNVLNYQRPALWVIVIGVIVVTVMGMGLSSNPNDNKAKKIAEWDRVAYFAPDAKQTMEIYRKALLESDYLTQLSLTHAEAFDPQGQEIWDTIKIKDVKVLKEDVHENKACYWLELDIKDSGNSAFETGIFPRWLWLVKGEQGWYVEGLMTSGPPPTNWLLSENKQEKAISIKDLTEKSIITSDRYQKTEYPLLAALPKEDIYLYGLKPVGVVLRYGDKLQLFNWKYLMPRFILPVLHKYDLDHDGEDEIICVLDAGSGTGLSLYELHVLKPSGASGYVDYMFSDYLEQVTRTLSATYYQKENNLVLKTNKDSYTYRIPAEYQNLTYKSIAYGDIVFFDISNGLKIKMPLGVYFDEMASPQFFEDAVFFNGDIVFKNGKFQIVNPQITK